MEPRLLIAYALMLAMALAGAALAFRLWRRSPRKLAARQRARDQHRYEQRLAEREVPRG